MEGEEKAKLLIEMLGGKEEVLKLMKKGKLGFIDVDL